MKTAVHHYEDKLLEFAYGELPSSEAAAVDAHVKGCTRCSEALTQIRSVRTAMSQLPAVPAPDAGLESLLAYAEQTAKRNAQGVKQAVWWRRYLMPMASAAALLVVGVVAWRASQEFNPDPGLMAIEMQKERDAKAVAPAQPVAAAPTPAPVVAGGKEGAKAENKADKKEEEVALDEGGAEQAEPRRKAAQPVADGRLNEKKQGGGGRAGAGEDANEGFADAFGTSAPLSQSKRDAKPKPVSKAPAKPSKLAKVDAPAEEPLAQDYSNAAQRGAYKTAPPKAEPPPMKDAVATKERADAPATPPAQTELSKNQRAPGTQAVWGLGTGGTSAGSGTGGVLGGTSSAGPVATVTPDTAKQEASSEAKSGAVSKKKAKSFDDEAAPPPPPAPVAAAPQPAPSSAPMGKGSMGLKPLTSAPGARSSLGDEDQAMAESTDKLAVDREAQYQQRNQEQLRQKTLEAARAASNRNDRMTEVKLSLEVLSSGAKGMERVEALKRVCDAYEAMGEYDRAQPYCDTLVREFPNTAAAQAVAQRRSRQEKAPAAKRAAQPADALEAAPQKEPAKPADTKPAEAY
jgi:hypothetical protein